MGVQTGVSTAAGREILGTATFAVLLVACVAGLTVLVLTDQTSERLEAFAALLGIGGVALGLMWWRVARLVRQLVAARQAAEASEARFLAAAANSPDAFVTLQALRDERGAVADFRVTYQNASAGKLWHDLGPNPGDTLLGSSLPAEVRRELLAMYRQVVDTGEARLEERQRTDPGMAPEWLEHRIVPLGDGVAVTWRDISERHRAEERLRYLAQVDSLTGLPNRSVFLDRLEQALLRARRSGRPMALLFLDVDHFKSINDGFGHAGGDALLRKLAERLRRSVRSVDTVARLAGDEFTVLLEQLHAADDADRVAATILRAARAPVQLEGKDLQVTLSVGIAIFDGGELGTTDLLNQADAALYAVKRTGRNGFLRYSPGLASAGAGADHAPIAESGRWPVG